MKLTTASILLVCLAGCSSSESTPPNTPASGNDSGTTTTTTNDSGTTTTTTGDDSGTTTTTGDDAGDDAGTTTAADCTGKGTAVAAPWTFAASATTLNGGKGQVLSINRCDTVTWTNTDTAPHSVIGLTGPVTFMTNQASGPSTALTPIQFTTAGTYTYDCGVHGMSMVGQITVAP